jgi:hypothetical protein
MQDLQVHRHLYLQLSKQNNKNITKGNDRQTSSNYVNPQPDKQTVTTHTS